MFMFVMLTGYFASLFVGHVPDISISLLLYKVFRSNGSSLCRDCGRCERRQLFTGMRRRLVSHDPGMIFSLFPPKDFSTLLCNATYMQRRRDTPLHEAVQNGHSHVVNVLLQKGADPEARNIVGRRLGRGGFLWTYSHFNLTL